MVGESREHGTTGFREEIFLPKGEEVGECPMTKPITERLFNIWQWRGLKKIREKTPFLGSTAPHFSPIFHRQIRAKFALFLPHIFPLLPPEKKKIKKNIHTHTHTQNIKAGERRRQGRGRGQTFAHFSQLFPLLFVVYFVSLLSS